MIEYKLKSFYCAANKSFIEYKKCTQCDSLMIVFKYRAKAPTTTTVYVLWQRKHFLLQLFIYIQNFWNIYFSINNLGYRYAFPVSLVKNKWSIFYYYIKEWSKYLLGRFFLVHENWKSSHILLFMNESRTRGFSLIHD